MSEYQYYEFQAVDRMLDNAARAKLRAISSRARITASSFVNHYDWGDLKADPLDLLTRYFDLFLYLANWGTRQFAMKLPRRLLEAPILESDVLDDDLVRLQPEGEHVILSICQIELDIEDWDDGKGWLGSLAPLRSDLLAGDLRLLPLLWLMQVETGAIDDDALEPAPGIGPLSPALAAFAEFFCMDGDLLEAAAGSASPQRPAEPSLDDVEQFVRELPEEEKVDLLRRLCTEDARYVRSELRLRCHAATIVPGTLQIPRRTAGELRAAARRIENERRRRAEEKAAAERRRREQEAAKAREQRLTALTARGEHGVAGRGTPDRTARAERLR